MRARACHREVPMTTMTTTHAAPDYTSTVPLGLHGGPVVIAARQDSDQHVLRAGAIVAARLGRRADIISALDPSQMYGWETGYGAFPRPIVQSLVEDRKRQLERELIAANVPLRAIAAELGSPTQVVTEVATAADAAMVVIGIGRHLPLDRLLGTETTLRVVQRSQVPVLAVPAKFDKLPSIVVVGADFSDTGWHAAACVLPLLGDGGTLHLVHVWHPSNLADDTHAELDERYRRELPMRFHELIESLAIPAGVTVQCETREGRVADRLLDFAQSRHADMIVVGRHGHGWRDRLRIGTVAGHVIRNATCAVLVVPEPPPHVREHAPVVHGRTGIRYDAEAWPWQLDMFSRRNAGRTTVLELSDAHAGSFAQERGYVLFGVSYDPEVNEVEIILGEAHGRTRHLTTVLRGVRSVAVIREANGADHAMRITHASGQALLTLVTNGAAAAPAGT